MMGAQASQDQLEKILDYIDDRQAGRRALRHRRRAGASRSTSLENGYYVEPTVFAGHNKMRIFQEEIFGPVLSVTKFKTSKTPSRSATTRSMAWAQACGRATAPTPIAWAARSKPAACGPTAITCIRRAQRSADTSSRASAARPTR